MPGSPRTEYLELADYTGALRRRWLTVVLFACIGAIAAAGYCVVAPKTYTGAVLVQVAALPTTENALGGRTAGPINMDNEAQIVQSAAVASIVKADLQSPLPTRDLVKQVGVTVPPNTTFLRITCKAPSPNAAQLCANAVGRAYLGYRRASNYQLIQSGLVSLQQHATTLDGSIQHLRKELGKGGLPASSPARVLAQLRLNADLSRLNTIQSHIDAVTPLRDSLAVVGSTLVGAVVTPAVRPSSPSSPLILLYVPSGLIAGLVIGLALAFARDRRNPRVHSAHDVERYFDLPMLLDVVRLGVGPVVRVASPRSRAGQAFTELGQYVAASLGDGDHVVLVAGTSAGPVGGVVAANLAVALARTRGETTLISADLSGSTISALFSVPNDRGLAEVIAGTAAIGDVKRRPLGSTPLTVVTPGTDTAGLLHNLQYDIVRKMVADLRSEARYVVIQAESVGDSGELFGFAEFADTAIVAVEVARTAAADVADCLHRLDWLRTAVLGAVVLPAIKGRQRRKAVAAAAADRHVRQAPGAAGSREGGGRRAKPPAGAGPRQSHTQDAAQAGRGSAPGLIPGFGAAADPVERQSTHIQGGAAAGDEGKPSSSAPRPAGETLPLPRVVLAESGQRPADQDNYPDYADPLSGS